MDDDQRVRALVVQARSLGLQEARHHDSADPDPAVSDKLCRGMGKVLAEADDIDVLLASVDSVFEPLERLGPKLRARVLELVVIREAQAIVDAAACDQ